MVLGLARSGFVALSIALLASSIIGCTDSEWDDGSSGLRLYASTINGSSGAPGPSTLLRLDPVTGALVSTIGPIGYRVNGLEYDHTNGVLYATTSFLDPTFPDGLISVNVTTGAGTPIGTGTSSLVNVPTVDSAGNMYGWTESGDDLVTIDKVAGTTAVVGPGTGTAQQGLAFDMNDALYLVEPGAVQPVNPTTGAVSASIGSIGTAHHGDFHPQTNEYWGIVETGAGGGLRTIVVADFSGAPAVVTTLTTDPFVHAITFAR